MLEIRHVSKSYKKQKALVDVSLTLKEGIYALLGPNGAGKSTLMSILCNQLKPDVGEVLWEGKKLDYWKNAYYELLGYAPQQQGLYDEFSGHRFLTYMAILKNIHRNDIPNEVARVARMVNMQEELEKKCGDYSGGMKQRILVAQALLGNPRLLLFDEPTAGLDPKERVSLRDVFHSLANDHILLIATHVVSDVECIAREVIFLKKGNIVCQGEVQKLLKTFHQLDLIALYLKLFQEELQ